jgi:mRNA interferase MazF
MRKEAGLIKPSVVKPVLATIEKRMVLKKLGALQTADVEALRTAIRHVFG